MTSTLDNQAPPSNEPTTAPKPQLPVQADRYGAPDVLAQTAQPQPKDLQTTPVNSGNTASNVSSTESGVNSGLAAQIATAISIGLSPSPQNPAQWAQLVDYYSTTAGQDALGTAEENGTTAANVSPAATQASGTGALGTNAFLAAIRQHESGGNYQAYNAGGGASGAYQFIQSTWTSEANAAGYKQYANEPAGKAPPAVQDAVAAHMANGYYSQYGNWADAAEAWYDPADVGKNVVPAPGAGNTETVTDYGAQIVAAMGQQPNLDPQHPSAGASSNVVQIAQGQIGTPYVWGGEDPSSPSTKGSFDCSGLVQWVYGQAGVALPRVAQAQYNATPKLAKNVQLQPGDLMFFGSGANGIEHVGIYIGNNQMIDAPHTGADVRIDQNPQAWGNYVGATRPGDPGGATTAGMATVTATPTVSSGESFGQILQMVNQQLTQLQNTYPGAGAAGSNPTLGM